MKLSYFKDISFLQAIKDLFNELNVPVNYVVDEPTTAKDILKDTYKENTTFQLVNEVYFVGMIDDAAFEGNKSLAVDKIKSDYDGILIFGVTLNQRENNLLPTRSQLAEISRAFNREFYYTPVVLVFKYSDDKGQYIAFANTERLQYKQSWREGEKAGKVSLLRDIDIQRPHRGHEDIINQLRIQTSGTKAVDSFAKLYNYWQEVFSVSVLNKRFYQELSNWYFWAVKQVSFPSKPTEVDAIKKNAKLEDLIQEHNATNVIRLLTRLLFTWFIKEKKLIPEELFDLEALQQNILNDIAPYHENGLFNQANKDSVYYKAILQNLFFASLNCPIKSDGTDSRERGFRGDGYGTHRGIDYLMRYKSYFKNPDAFLELMNSTVPFLNGGLFECLDDKYSNTYIDGFSDQMTKGELLVVPDYLFFGTSEEIDLSMEYGVNNNTTKKAAVKGLINILKSYKFTITENTPIEEDVALDPELLGKVFENLLASYNPETKTTARKQTGSFYTPREIVNYMVDESLIAYLKNAVENAPETSSLNNVPETSSFSQNEFPFFDPASELQIKEGKLPHWQQDGVYYFVTFRLDDSIPHDKSEELKTDRENWKNKNKDKKEFTKQDWKEYNRLFHKRVEEWMNAGYGSCLLNKNENALIIANALKHFEDTRYVLDEWIVMPNHVHVLVKPNHGFNISDILHSWKSFSANEINKIENRTGQLWMHESYDHIVRNEDALKAIRHYIRQNPVKANIVPKASSFSQNSMPKASSFSQNSIPVNSRFEVNQTQSKDALDTMLHQLASFDSKNPFAESSELTRNIIFALDRCKILDPACGSGAFPMGVLQKMVHMLQKLDPDNLIWKEVQIQKVQEETSEVFKTIDDKVEREEKLKEINNAFDQRVNDPDYARKLYLIENCIYGVDIQPIATQISKLRFFISLVVDQKCTIGILADGIHNNFGIRPLPNLETKFVAANTLIGINKEANLFTTEAVKDLENQLKQIRHKLFSARTKDTKLKYRQKDEELRNAIAEELKNQGLPVDSAEKLAKWDPYNQNASSPFFDPEWMFDIAEGFDVVIGNPPYLGNKEIGAENQKLFKVLFGFTDDMYNYFYHKGISFLTWNGVITYITPNTFLTLSSKKNLRKLFIGNKLEELFLVGYVFNEAYVDTIITRVLKNDSSAYEFMYKIAENSFSHPKKYIGNIDLYVKSPDNIFYPPSICNININSYLKDSLTGLYGNYKDFIYTLNSLKKNYSKIIKHRSSLKPNDLTLLGLVSEGSQGLVTGNNSKYLAVICQNEVEEQNIIQEFIFKIKNYNNGVNYENLSKNELYLKAERIKIETTNPSFFGKFFLYKTVLFKDVKHFDELTVNEQENGVEGDECWVFYSRGNENGLKWKVPFVEAINWTKKNVKELKEGIKTNSRWQGSEFYSYTGFGWVDYFTNQIKAFFVEKGPYSKNVVKFHSLINLSDRFFTAILNSKFITYYIKNFLTNTHTLQINDGKLIPIKIPSLSLLSYLELISSIIIFNHRILFEQITDALVFNLYFPDHMKEREIDVLPFVERDIEKIMQGREFEKLSDTEKEQVIEQLHQVWSHPDNEVRNRIKLFAVRSPEILKPILES